MNTNSCPANT